MTRLILDYQLGEPPTAYVGDPTDPHDAHPPTMDDLTQAFRALMDLAVDHPDFQPLAFQAALMEAITTSVDSMSEPPPDPVHSEVQSGTPNEED